MPGEPHITDNAWRGKCCHLVACPLAFQHPSLRACLQPGDAKVSDAAEALNAWLRQSPVCAAAAGRLIAQHRTAADLAAAPDASAAAAAMAQQVRAAMHNVLRVALRPLLAAQLAPEDSPQAADVGPLAADRVCWAVPALLSAPGLTAALPPELRRQLSSSRGLDQCCRWLLLLPDASGREAISPASAVRDSPATRNGAVPADVRPPVAATGEHSAMRNLAMLTLTEGPSTVRNSSV